MNRIHELDALRGLAILGILVVNIMVFHAPYFHYTAFYSAFKGAEELIVYGVVEFFSGKFLFVFAFLFLLLIAYFAIFT